MGWAASHKMEISAKEVHVNLNFTPHHQFLTRQGHWKQIFPLFSHWKRCPTWFSIHNTYLYRPITPCVLSVLVNVFHMPPDSQPFCACIFVLMVSRGWPTATLVVPYRTPTDQDMQRQSITSVEFWMSALSCKSIYNCSELVIMSAHTRHIQYKISKDTSCGLFIFF